MSDTQSTKLNTHWSDKVKIASSSLPPTIKGARRPFGYCLFEIPESALVFWYAYDLLEGSLNICLQGAVIDVLDKSLLWCDRIRKDLRCGMGVNPVCSSLGGNDSVFEEFRITIRFIKIGFVLHSANNTLVQR